MTLHRHALSALVLFFGGVLLAPGDAQARVNVFWKFNAPDVTGSSLMRGSEGMVIVDNDPTNEVASVELRVSSDAGDEDLALTESNAWLHGSAALAALPARDAALTLTLYDKGSASLMTFSGTLATDGTVTLEAKSDETWCDKSGCTSLGKYDVQFIGGETNADVKGYLLNFDFTGVDTYEVAYATVEVSGGEKAEVDWDAVGSVWTANSTLEHTGVIEVKARVLDGEGNTVENVKAELAEPWLDDGEGVNALSAGSGTSVAISSHFLTDRFAGGHQRTDRMTVVSDGWTTTSYPTHAELELAGGETVSVPANSYQRHNTDLYPIADGYLNSGERDSRISISGGNFILKDHSTFDLATPLCSSGTCVVLVEGEKGYELSVTAYGTDPGKLPDKQDFALVLYDAKGTKVASETIGVEFDAEVTAVFASELEIDGDPIGSDASGSVSLLGAADKKGKQATLSKGTFYGSFSRDPDGDLALAGYGTDDWATSDTSADVLLGDPVEVGDDDVPPAVVFRAAGAGGKITKIVVSSGGFDY